MIATPIKGEAPRVPQAIRVDLLSLINRRDIGKDEGIVGRNTILASGAVGTDGIDALDLAEKLGEVL